MLSEESRNTIINILNGKDTSREAGYKVASAMEMLFNCYSSYSKLAKELYQELKPVGKRRLMALLSISAFSLCHKWRISGLDDWDDRRKASESFAYKNEGIFEELFNENAGFSIEKREYNTEYPPTDVSCIWTTECIQKIKESDSLYLLGYLSKWINCHPTLQQAFFGGCVQGILVDNYKKRLVPPLNYDCITFPFY